jgi:hypothetical protein
MIVLLIQDDKLPVYSTRDMIFSCIFPTLTNNYENLIIGNSSPDSYKIIKTKIKLVKKFHFENMNKADDYI